MRQPRTYSTVRLNLIWGVFVVFFAIIFLRLFYLQIIRHDHFLDQANASQIKSLEVEADRGRIYALNNQKKVPLVINERRWTMFSDTKFIEDVDRLITALENLGLELSTEQKVALASDSRYVVLQKRLTDEQKNDISRRLEVRGVYFQKQSIRQYLEGSLASHVLGFLNDDSQGQYGIEQFHDQTLTGRPGQLRITTDVHDVPLLFVEDNIFIEPQAGEDIVLTLDVSVQRIVEDQLRQGVIDTESKSGTAIVLNADTGAILAMANYPDFDPANFRETELEHYVNDAVESVLEPASIMKVLLMATALNEGAVDPEDSYYNPQVQVVDGYAIHNLTDRREGVLPVTEILTKSLNTGSVEMLKRLGDGPTDQVDVSDREVWYRYLTEKFRLQQRTGIGLPNEVQGTINPPDYPWVPNHLYATMTFGQSLTVTPIQLAATYASVFNGGHYYQPYVVSQIGDKVQAPRLIEEDILKQTTVDDLLELMSYIGRGVFLRELQHEGLQVSSKTGSAQVVDFEKGGYVEGAANGLMIGYIKSQDSTLVVLVIVEEPQVLYAGLYGAGPIWKEIVRNIISLGRIH